MQIFDVLRGNRSEASIGKEKCFSVLRKSGLDGPTLSLIWRLSDVDADGFLSKDEFVLAMHLTNARVKGGLPLPDVLPDELRPPYP